jgi:inositol transport system substrate-binding protein
MFRGKTFVGPAVALIGAVALFAGCAAPAQRAADTSSGGKGYRVAYIARAQTDSFAAWLANEIKAEANKYPDIKLEVFDGQANDDTENRMIENAIANKYDAVIVQVNNGPAQQPYVKQLVSAGIKTITTNPRLKVDGASSIDANPYDQGAVVAKYALKQVPQGAQVVVLNGPGGNFHSDQRRKAWKEEFFDKRPDVKIVAEDIAKWNKDEALKLMEDWILAHKGISAVISMNDNMAAGALEAVSAQGGDMLAYGVDGTPEAALLIQQGKMTATALQSARDLAQLNLKAVHDLLTGAQKSVELNIDAPLISKENAGQYVTMYKEAGLIKN